MIWAFEKGRFKYFLFALIVSGFSFLIVRQRLNYLQLKKEVVALRREHDSLVRRREELAARRARSLSVERVSRKARQELGLKRRAPRQVVYVQTPSGKAVTGRSRSGLADDGSEGWWTSLCRWSRRTWRRLQDLLG